MTGTMDGIKPEMWEEQCSFEESQGITDAIYSCDD